MRPHRQPLAALLGFLAFLGPTSCTSSGDGGSSNQHTDGGGSSGSGSSSSGSSGSSGSASYDAGDTGAAPAPSACGGQDLGSVAGSPGTTGSAGNAVGLDGTNWVTVAKAGNYAPTAGFTWEAWFKGSSLPTDTTPGTMDGASNGQMLFVVADPQSCVDINLGFGGTFRAPADLVFSVDGPNGCGDRDTTPVNFRPAGGFQNDRWYHAAGVRNYTAQCAGLYLDGVLVASKTDMSGPIQAAGFAASIGRWTDGNYDWSHFKGAIDEVRVYGRPLSAAEIGRHFNGGVGGPGTASDPGLVAGWHLDETTGTVAADFGSSHLDGTFVNSPSHVQGIVPLP